MQVQAPTTNKSDTEVEQFYELLLHLNNKTSHNHNYKRLEY